MPGWMWLNLVDNVANEFVDRRLAIRDFHQRRTWHRVWSDAWAPIGIFETVEVVEAEADGKACPLGIATPLAEQVAVFAEAGDIDAYGRLSVGWDVVADGIRCAAHDSAPAVLGTAQLWCFGVDQSLTFRVECGNDLLP